MWVYEYEAISYSILLQSWLVDMDLVMWVEPNNMLIKKISLILLFNWLVCHNVHQQHTYWKRKSPDLQLKSKVCFCSALTEVRFTHQRSHFLIALYIPYWQCKCNSGLVVWEQQFRNWKKKKQNNGEVNDGPGQVRFKRERERERV